MPAHERARCRGQAQGTAAPLPPLGPGPPQGREAAALTRLLPTKLPSLCPPSRCSRLTVLLRPPVLKLSEEAGDFPVSPGKGKPL